jgi:dihydrofolate reductase
MWNLVTLDGYFDGERDWEIDWHKSVWGEQLEYFSLESRSAGMLLFERRTYEGMAAYWSRATGSLAKLVNALPKVVFSKTLRRVAWRNTRLVTGDPAAEVIRLKCEPGKDLVMFGSASLAAALASRHLIDEYRLGVHPVVVADGVPLFTTRSLRTSMALLEAKPVGGDRVVLRYAPKPQEELARPEQQGVRSRSIKRSRLVDLGKRSATMVDGPFAETKEWPLGSERAGDRHARIAGSGCLRKYDDR